MIIKKNVHDYIVNNVPDFNFESGGMLGADYKKIITSVQLDAGLHFQGMKICSYYPDTDMLNKCILEWSKKDITFSGIFHTHFSEVASFSAGDLKYIKEILLAMPEEIDTVYFPLLLMPERKLIPFKAQLVNEQVSITEDTLNMDD